MATPNGFFHLMTLMLLYSSLLLILFSYIPQKSVALESHFENVAIECKRLLSDSKEMPQSTIEVVHMYGPCSPAAEKTSLMNMPSTQLILDRDQVRVESLQARLKPKTKKNKYNSVQFENTKEVANLIVQSSPGDYAISINLGTPGQELSLIFDTGSDLTWTRCKSNPYASTSFSNISCNSPVCTQLLLDHTCDQFNDEENLCFYEIQYGDGSYTKGLFSMDSLNITQTGDVFPDFLFGCSTETESHVAGILGLGRDPAISFLAQTEQTYKGIFSYCLPSTPTSTGFLKLGPRSYPNDVKFTRFSTNSDYPSFYFIDVTSIKVGGVQLSIDLSDFNYPGTIIDSGTVITRLSMNIYNTMRDEFQKQMNNSGYGNVQEYHLFDTPSVPKYKSTCYDTSNDSNIKVPIISFTFNDNVTIDLDGSATLYVIDSTLACLAFAGNSDPGDLAIFGNTQQKKFEVVYDVDGGKLGFIHGGCN
ncbi:hypothetical protein CASFOL_027386 [Castilleja foliolosa]|uniref:Peptidase A1 domain-containing protein n=1 Tax=Castilleja foliolosa TaxID=1961234 RepID=A0ABD3CEP1_9LAMI